MRYAIVNTQTKELLTVVEYEDAPSGAPPGFDDEVIAVQSDEVGGDWSWDGTTLIPPTPTLSQVFPCLSVTPAQAKVALYNAGLLDQVEGSIASSYRPIQIYWNAASAFERYHPYILGIAALIGLSDQQLDDLFAAAALL